MSPTSQNPPDLPQEGGGQFGPGGYLPQKAAARARKIVLREQMGLHWTIAAIVSGVLIAAITIPLVITGSRAPQPPFVEVGPLSLIDPLGSEIVSINGASVLVVRGGGSLSAFTLPPGGSAYCPASRLIEAPSGGVWSLQGRSLSGSAASLAPLRAVAYDDRLFIDPTPTAPLPAAESRAVASGCHG